MKRSISYYINSIKANPVAEGYTDTVAIHNYDADGACAVRSGCEYWQKHLHEVCKIERNF